ncbi:MAG: homogentisate 1,2-dioxygenase, partial [Firmicutes bacterium]|nr:homogentisate 1,2-dioxygenase [Bacillota bacterium]
HLGITRFTHGPHPKAFQAGREHKKKFTDEVAVMLDTRDSLSVGDAAAGVENPEYVNSWQEKK